MSEHLHPGVHPDADSLSAFVEGVLPEHERAQCLAHLAECSRCREIVFLTQDAPVAAESMPVLVPAPPRRRWLRMMPLLATAAAVCVALLGAWLYLRSRTVGAPSSVLVARVSPAPSPAPDIPTQAKARAPIPRKASSPASHAAPEPPRTAPEGAVAEPTSSATATAVEQGSIPPAPKPPPSVAAVTTEVSSGISGVVTDASGAAVPNATVRLRQLAGASTTDARTDHAGQFKFAGLLPGQYELRVSAPGFRETAQRVELQPQEIAAVKSELQIGSVSETVEVTSAASTIQTESASVSTQSRRKRPPPEPRPLPSNLPTETSVTHGKVILATDSAGTLFYSGNAGKSWRAVKPQWQGGIDELLTPPDVPLAGKAIFQITTDSDSVWLSRDGRHWRPAPAQH